MEREKTRLNLDLLFVKLRASGETIAETAEALNLTLREAWDMESRLWSEIQTDADVKELKRELNRRKRLNLN